MKTAMQELLDELNLIQIVDRDKLFMVKHIIHKCLEKEKEQTIDFVEWAFNHRLNFQPSKKGMLIGLDMKSYSIEDLLTEYNQKYNQNK